MSRTLHVSLLAGFLGLAALLLAHPSERPSTLIAAGACQTSRTSLGLDTEEQTLLQRINSYRASSGLPSLTLSLTLVASAQWKSNDLAANGYFAHDDQFRSWSQRITDCGYTGTPNVAETLAAGNQDAASTFEQWRSSSAHNAIMLSPSMRAVGIARAFVTNSPFGWYWTADFGARDDSNAAPPANTTTSGNSAPTQSGGAATPAPTQTAPANQPATRGALSVGATAIVTGTGDCLRVHAAAALTSQVTGCLNDGTGMVVVDGPVSADGYTWWKLGALGWAVDTYLRGLP